MTSIEEASGTPNEEFKTYYGNPRFAAKFVDGLKDYVRGKSVTITTGRLTEIEELGRYAATRCKLYIYIIINSFI